MEINTPTLGDYSGFSVEVLQHNLETAILYAEYHERMAQEFRAKVASIQSELDRRELEAFWQAHPGVRLNADDKLLITENAFRWEKTKTPPNSMHVWVIGKEARFIGIPIDNDRVYVGYRSYWVACPLDIAREMRTAYLSQHPEDTQ